jgi:hypothetical protein
MYFPHLFPQPIPSPLARSSLQVFAPASASTLDWLLTNMSIALAQRGGMVCGPYAILKFPCFRFAVYDHTTRRRIGSQSSSGRHLLRQNIDLKVYGAGSSSSGGCYVFICTVRQPKEPLFQLAVPLPLV